jgi:hypothetical protein
MTEPTGAQVHADRQAQRVTLEAFFRKHPGSIWGQDTLAAECGAHLGAVRTRISELKRGGLSLVGHLNNYRDKAGVYHRGPKRWQYVPRPESWDTDAPKAQPTLFDRPV